jgi:hypothetical protein
MRDTGSEQRPTLSPEAMSAAGRLSVRNWTWLAKSEIR